MSKNHPALPEAVQELATMRDFARWGYSQFNAAGLFFGHGTDNGLDEAVTLVLHALHLPHDMPEILWETRLTTTEKQAVYALLQSRIEQRKPAAYLTGEIWFAGLQLYVDERVLVPRSPLAETIEQGFAPWKQPEGITAVLDLCTGGGCIALACAAHLPAAMVDATDISADALAVAEINLKEYGLEQRVRLWQGDLFQSIPSAKYDVIVSNPPYVPQAEFEALPDEYHFEPELGLVAGQDGLSVVRRILAQAADYLKPNGILMVEVGIAKDALMEAYPQVPFIWLEFTRGGEGVFLLDAEQCRYYRTLFQTAAQHHS